MKTLLMTHDISKFGGSVNNQTTNELQNITGRNLRSQAPNGCGNPAQSGRIPARGQQDSVLMMSQLG
jgi:hypothetical protein